MNNYYIRAKEIISEIIYITIATADTLGKPWNTPVFVAYDHELNFYWSSSPLSQHSKNITVNHAVFIVIYNSKAGEGEGDGVYMEARAEEVTDREEINKALDLLGKRRGAPFTHPEKFLTNGSQRIYKVTPLKIWINDADKDTDGDFIKDYRVEISLNELSSA